MSNSESDPLLRWNALNRANAENAIVTSMLQSALAVSPKLDRHSTWLLAGTGATAALLVANLDAVLSHLGSSGFRIAGSILIGSGLFGLLAKWRALQAQFALANDRRIRRLMSPILQAHEADQEKIEENAERRGLQLETEIDIKRVVSEFARLFPRWVWILTKRHLQKHDGDPQVGYIKPIQWLVSQGIYTLIQTLLFAGFFASILLFAEAI